MFKRNKIKAASSAATTAMARGTEKEADTLIIL